MRSLIMMFSLVDKLKFLARFVNLLRKPTGDLIVWCVQTRLVVAAAARRFDDEDVAGLDFRHMRGAEPVDRAVPRSIPFRPGCLSSPPTRTKRATRSRLAGMFAVIAPKKRIVRSAPLPLACRHGRCLRAPIGVGNSEGFQGRR
ncbi:hypothetical protein [Pararobbsia alpina]|uniref:hypothetical protein n=1 Tax=Pararobbsia alpina TaxID=621374 RepID=UPI001FE8A118|nr:hypothetical protein [Pararobbsia alpina]